MSSNALQFRGLVFFSGSDLLPQDVPLDLQSIRRWAFERGLVFEPESQLLGEERLRELAKCFTSEDELMVAVVIRKDLGEWIYAEYPYLPVKSLIRRAEEVEIVYWRMVPTGWDAGGQVSHYGEVRFGFWYPGCEEEMCSLSTAKRVTAKFGALLSELSREYEARLLEDGSKEITVDGAVRARFFREGRFFDVGFSVSEEQMA